MNIHTRREFLGTAAGAAALIAVPRWPAAQAVDTGPRLLKAAAGTARLLGDKGPETEIWGYNGRAPGPVLRVRQGDSLAVRLANALPQGTSIHWHGVRLPNAMDGVSGLTQEAVPTDGTFDYRFSPPDAGTYWYHSHNRSWEQMARGLHGMLIVEEAEPPPVDHDIPFVIDDWRLDQQARLHEASFGNIGEWAHGGRLGNWLTVNGANQPSFAVKAGDRVRLRVLNAANARIMELSFGDHRPMLIALDGQPVTPRAPGQETLVLAPGQRADLMIDMALNPGVRAPVRFVMDNETVEVAHFVYDAGKPRRENPLDGPMALPPNPLPHTLDLAGAAPVALSMEGGAMGGMRGAMMGGRMMGMNDLVAEGKVWAFNGVAGRPDKPLLRVERGRTAVIDMTNANAWPHAMHLHGHHFRVVRRGGKPVDNAPWRDTELVLPNERVSIAFVAGGAGKWLFHCHMLEHQAGGMATWIEVV